MDAALHAGVAVYNDGHYHAAHDAWEDEWLALEDGTTDERLLHGLVQFTAAVHHARRRNWSGAVGLCESGREYLAAVPDGYRSVNVAGVGDYLGRLGADPERAERTSPPALTVGGNALGFDDLEPPAAVEAAVVLADALGYDREEFEAAAEYARGTLADGEYGEFAGLLCDFVVEREQRALVATRLGQHVRRKQRRADDVAGLFD